MVGGGGAKKISSFAEPLDLDTEVVSANTVRKLEPLKEYFCSEGRVEYMGCKVASGRLGRQLLIRTAEALNVEAHGYTGSVWWWGWKGGDHLFAIPGENEVFTEEHSWYEGFWK